jgi:hypothetical protein
LVFDRPGIHENVPLYCCEVCGWATSSFRVDAVNGHETDCPECAGALRLVFHIDSLPLDPEPTTADLQAERDRAAERSARWAARKRVQTRGRPWLFDGKRSGSRLGSPRQRP